MEIPRGLSLLAFHDADAEVRGLETFARDLWPPVIPVHLAFQIMVTLGTMMAVVSLWAVWTFVRRRALADRRALLIALVVVAPFGFIATEAGWMVTEIGRQPWIVQGTVRTADAVTSMPGLVVSLGVVTAVYLGLAAIVVALIRSMIRETQ